MMQNVRNMARVIGAGLVVSLLASAASTVRADDGIYVDDSQDVPVFSNQPADDNAEPLELPEPNIVPAPGSRSNAAATERSATSAGQTRTRETSENAGATYERVWVIEPEARQVIEQPGSFTVITDPEPRLQSGHRTQLYIDGQPQGRAELSTAIEVPATRPGTYILQVVIRDQNGAVVGKSLQRQIEVR